MKFSFDKNSKRLWLAIVGSLTIVMLAAYTLAQQTSRMSVDDQPLILAQSISHRLDSGFTPAQVVPQAQSDLRTDIIPFAIVTDSQQKVLASSATMGYASLLPPPGTFDYAKAHGSDTFTWQPAPNIRIATVIKSYKNGSKYIVAGQSLSEAESRIDVYGILALMAWLGVVIWTTLALAWHRK